jgi:type IV secretion system protein VirD4
MQLPPDDEIVMVAGVAPIRAKKARYFEDRRLAERILPAPKHPEGATNPKLDDWSALAPVQPPAPVADNAKGDGIAARPNSPRREGKVEDDSANAGLRREPGLERHKDVAPKPMKPAANEFDPDMDKRDDDAVRVRVLARNARNVARQISMDPGDGMEL